MGVGNTIMSNLMDLNDTKIGGVPEAELRDINRLTMIHEAIRGFVNKKIIGMIVNVIQR